MEHKELLTRLAEFFTEWNRKHAPTNRVNRLRIEMTNRKLNYVFNGQILCQIDIYSAQKIRKVLGDNGKLAQKQLLLSILETTSNLATNPELETVSNSKERAEIITLLLRLYHALEEDVFDLYPEIRVTFNQKYFYQINDHEKQQALMEKIEDFQHDLLTAIKGDEIPVGRIERRVRYINQLSIAELCILLNAVVLITGSHDWQANIQAASDLIRRLVF